MTDTTPAKATNLIAMYKAAIGEKNQAYYLEKFKLFDQEKDSLKPSWNWWAFLSFGTWALYRKMYGWAFIWVLIEVVMVVVSKIKPSDTFNWVTVLVILAGLATLAIWIASGLYGNALYHRFINKKIRKAENADVNAEEQAVIQRLNRSSGVHAWVLYLTAASLLFIALCIVWMLFVIPKNDVAKVDEQPSAVTTQIKKETINQNTGLFANFEIVDTPSAVELSQIKNGNTAKLNEPPAIETGKTESIKSEKTKDLSKTESANIAKYQQALAINPVDDGAWQSLGTAYRHSNQYSDAINAYLQALRINPENPWAWNYLGWAYSATEQYPQAINAYHQALRINPDYGVAWDSLGGAYYRMKQYPLAINAYQQYLRIDPENPYILNALGDAYYYAGNHAKVTEVYKKLKALDAAMAEKFFNEFILPKG
jgi:tetratricopeptide (TPR) repeat protein